MAFLATSDQQCQILCTFHTMLFLEKKLNRQASHMPIQLIRKALYVYIFTRVKQ